MTNGIPTSPASGKGAPLIQGKIASYPEEWLGQWGGAPGISSVYERIPVERIKKGSSGIVVFSFLKSDEGINLLPTNVFFPVTVTKLADQRLSEANLRKLEMRGETKGDQMMPGVPVIELRDSTYKSIRQENLKATVLRNILRLLKPDVLEQDIILCVRISGANEAPRYMYRESIIRLTRNRKDLLLVQIGHIGYAPTGERDFQYSMQGWLTPRWRSYATAIEKLVRSTVADLGYDELCTGMAESPKR